CTRTPPREAPKNPGPSPGRTKRPWNCCGNSPRTPLPSGPRRSSTRWHARRARPSERRRAWRWRASPA
ncbi:MAG: hypothetical protein AVDCRST_MAG22-3632, partial [uncultured Rubrobacteraceae bacterium]